VALYWSSTTVANLTLDAWRVNLTEGSVGSVLKTVNFVFVTAVRGGS
jgi:hypothetical protein